MWLRRERYTWLLWCVVCAVLSSPSTNISPTYSLMVSAESTADVGSGNKKHASGVVLNSKRKSYVLEAVADNFDEALKK